MDNNTLFAQSADLTANALISIGKEKEVLKHVMRYGQLIIPLDEALVVALELIDVESYIDALELLQVVEKYLTEALEQVSRDNGLSYSDFLDLYDLQIQLLQSILQNILLIFLKHDLGFDCTRDRKSVV